MLLKLSSSRKNNSPPPPSYTLELLAVAVSLFFVATVALTGDKLIVTPPESSSVERVVIDAEALLQAEFDRVSSSVEF